MKKEAKVRRRKKLFQNLLEKMSKWKVEGYIEKAAMYAAAKICGNRIEEARIATKAAWALGDVLDFYPHKKPPIDLGWRLVKEACKNPEKTLKEINIKEIPMEIRKYFGI